MISEEDALIAEMEEALKGHKNDLEEGARVKLEFDDVLKPGLLGRVVHRYLQRERTALRVRWDGKGVWYMNRFQVSRAKEDA